MCKSCKLCQEKFNKMKIIIIPIFIYLIILTIAQVGAYTTLLNNRPVIDLRRPSPPPPMLPQDRRSALFPKSNVKFVVNGNSYEKQILSAPLETTSNFITKNVYTRNVQRFRPTESTVAQASRFTPLPLEDKNPNDYFSIDRVKYEKTPTRKDTSFVSNYFNYNLSTENISTVHTPSEVVNNRNIVVLPHTNIANKVKVSESELYNVKKEMTLDETTVNTNKVEKIKDNESEILTINDLILPKIVEENKTSENPDNDYLSEEELIEVLNTENGKDLLFPLIGVEDTEMMIPEETATDVTITDEFNWEKSRDTRSVNVIEEENLASTVSGFRFTGREPRVNSNQAFRNINS